LAFDLNALDTVKAAEEGFVLEVRHPATGAVLSNGDGTSVTLTLGGMDSRRAKTVERGALNRRLKQNSGRRSTVTAEDIEADALEVLAAITLGWSGFIVDGAAIECTPENAKRVYRQWPWLREQAQAAAEDRSNFLKASPQS
jgi:hypothetical protein